MAAAGSYSDPTGFSLTYPDGWEAITESRVNNTADVLPETMLRWLRTNRINFNAVKLILLRDGAPDTFLENVNVVVVDGEIPLTDKAVQELSDVVPRQYANVGVRIANLRMRVEERGGRKLLVSDYQLTFPPEVSEVGTVQQRQFQIPGGGKTFTVTCTSRPETFATWEGAFEQVATSFQGPPSGSTGSVLGQALKSGAVWGVIGAVIGGIVGGLISVLSKKRRPPTPPALPTA